MSDALHEFTCPACGATTRARMADQPEDLAQRHIRIAGELQNAGWAVAPPFPGKRGHNG